MYKLQIITVCLIAKESHEEKLFSPLYLVIIPSSLQINLISQFLDLAVFPVQSSTKHPELSSPFLDQDLNKTRVTASSGEQLTLNCRVDRHQVRYTYWGSGGVIVGLFETFNLSAKEEFN